MRWYSIRDLRTFAELYNPCGVGAVNVLHTQGALRDPGLRCRTPSGFFADLHGPRDATGLHSPRDAPDLHSPREAIDLGGPREAADLHGPREAAGRHPDFHRGAQRDLAVGNSIKSNG